MMVDGDIKKKEDPYKFTKNIVRKAYHTFFESG